MDYKEGFFNSEPWSLTIRIFIHAAPQPECHTPQSSPGWVTDWNSLLLPSRSVLTKTHSLKTNILIVKQYLGFIYIYLKILHVYSCIFLRLKYIFCTCLT